MKKAKIILGESGFALLMVLWVTILLMIIVMSFSLLSKAETHATFYFRESIAKKRLAEAGLNRAIMEIYYRQANKNQTITPETGALVRVDGTSLTDMIGEDKYTVRIFDEAGKLNLNSLNDRNRVVLENLLHNLGLSKETIDTIVDSTLDWMDKDNLHRLHGAEDDYYQSLENPYKAKNGPFDVLEELLLVKGVTEEIVFGTKEKKGLVDFVTIYGNSTKINVNVASREIIMALPEMTEDIADRIISQRETAELKSIDDVRGLMGAVYSSVSSFIDTGESNSYTIQSTGYRKDGKNGHSIRATVLVQSTGTYQFASYKTPAETLK